jgi:ribokinase
MADVVALGDVNVDIIAHFAEFPAKGDDALASLTEIHCGGSAANTAMALARMGMRTSLVSRVGPDSWALKVYSCLEEAGVAPAGLQRDPTAMTGLMYVVVTSDGERTIFGHRGANVFTDPNQIDEEELAGARLFHLSGYALLADPQRSAALRALEAACRHGLKVTLDPGMAVPRKALDEMRALLPTVNILMPSLGEARHLTGQTEPETCARALLEAGVEVVALKLGGEGCLIATDGGMLHVPGFAIQARDSTGAGDNFDAGLIAGFLGGLGWHSAAVLANAMGAMAAARIGAGTAGPKAREVMALLRGDHPGMDQENLEEAIGQAFEFVADLSTEPEEEERPWWK